MTLITIQNYIDGKYCAPTGGQYLEGFNPATGNVFSQVPDSHEADVSLAVQAAKKALPAWKAMPSDDRFRILNAIAEGIEANLTEFAEAESMDQGYPEWHVASCQASRKSI